MRPRPAVSIRLGLQHLAIAGIVFLAVLLLWNIVHPSRGVASAVAGGSAPAAPGLALPSLTSTATVRLQSYAGRVVVVAFWASWCAPCKSELPTLEKLWRRYRSGPVVILALDVHDNSSDARAFVQAHKLTFPIAVDHSEKSLNAYGVQALPELFVISPDGHVVEHFRGLMSPAEIERAVLRHM